MAEKKTSVTNMESEDRLLMDVAEGGTSNGDSSAAKGKPQIKRQKSRVASKKKERTFDWPKKSFYEATYYDSITAEEVRHIGKMRESL